MSTGPTFKPYVPPPRGGLSHWIRGEKWSTIPWPESESKIVERHKEAFTIAFRACGISPPKYATASSRGWKRFLAYALKRACSNHPHNVKWKPLQETYTAMQVAKKLEG